MYDQEQRRVRLFRLKSGFWRFAYETRIAAHKAWERVQVRGEGQPWGYAEARKRAGVYAELVGARIVAPKPPTEQLTIA